MHILHHLQGRSGGGRGPTRLRAAAVLLPLVVVVILLLVEVIGNAAGPDTDSVAAPVAAIDVARPRARCPECGVVGLTRALEAPAEASSEGSDRGYEVSIRMMDGSQRRFADARRANWRPGERVIVIGGDDPSGE